MRWKTETGMSSFLGGGSFYVVLHLGRPLMRNLGPECSISPDCQASLRAQALPTKLLHSGALDWLVDCVDLKLRVACSKQSLLLSGPMAHMMEFFPPQPYNRASAPLSIQTYTWRDLEGSLYTNARNSCLGLGRLAG